MRIFNLIWYGFFGLVVFPFAVVLCVIHILHTRNLYECFVFGMLAGALFMCGKVSLRKFNELRKR